MAEFPTLPDYLMEGLDIVFVGLNPSLYSARTGHYFANPRNRFWMALNRSGLVDVGAGAQQAGAQQAGAQQAGAQQAAPLHLSPEQDYQLLHYGIGFTDVVKRPTPQASSLTSADFQQWAPVLKAKLLQYQPRIACFHGVTGYKAYSQYAEGVKEQPGLGLQERTIGNSRIFVVPNPSPANAHFSLDDLVYWYQRLKTFREELANWRGPEGPAHA